MQPLQDLLHRIRWDPEFGKGSFALGYYDRIAGREEIVGVSAITLDAGGASFTVEDENGAAVHIPLHRVRTVYKDGVAIWHRPG